MTNLHETGSSCIRRELGDLRVEADQWAGTTEGRELIDVLNTAA